MTNITLETMRSALSAELAGDRKIHSINPNLHPVPPASPTIEYELVEDYTRFSESRIWEFQRAFFENAGASAWSESIVPHYVTSNMFIARSYAQMVAAFMEGQEVPVTIVELGAGSGQFSFHFLENLSTLVGEADFHYVITDFTQENLDFCAQQAEFRDFVAAGRLGFARLDATAPELFPALETPGPVVVIANYLFDTIPQDLFQVRDGQLEACQVRLDRKGPLRDNPLSGLQTSYQEETVTGDYYGEAALDAVLAHYRREFPAARVLFPLHGIRILEWFRAHSDGQVLLLSGDKGYAEPADVVATPYPALVNHGSFSLNVNYHAFRVYAAQSGGRYFGAGQKGESLNVCALHWGAHAGMAKAFARYIGGYGPDDFFVLKREIERNMNAFSVEALLAYVRMAAYDPKALLRALPYLQGRIGEFSERSRANLGELVDRVWDNFYGLPTELDWSFKTGELLLQLQQYQLAVRCFVRSEEVYGPRVQVLCALARACMGLQDGAGARKVLAQCLELAPDYSEARKLLNELSFWKDAS